jgi:methyl-accepting chemotaxis protein
MQLHQGWNNLSFRSKFALLSEASSQTAASLREVNGAIAQLTEAAQGLRYEVSHFKVANNY